MDYSYIKMFDKGLLDNKIWLAPGEEPNETLIKQLALEYDESSQEWFTTLIELSHKGVEIVSITPYEQEQVGRKTRIKNQYILKIQEPDYLIE